MPDPVTEKPSEYVLPTRENMTADLRWLLAQLAEAARVWKSNRTATAVAIVENAIAYIAASPSPPAGMIEQAHKALTRAVRTIRLFHGLGLPKGSEPAVWAAYQASPEMKEINAALSAITEKQP